MLGWMVCSCWLRYWACCAAPHYSSHSSAQHAEVSQLSRVLHLRQCMSTLQLLETGTAATGQIWAAVHRIVSAASNPSCGVQASQPAQPDSHTI